MFKEDLRGVPLRQRLNKTMPLIHPIERASDSLSKNGHFQSARAQSLSRSQCFETHTNRFPLLP
jgi:hypothetical protein